MRLFKQKAGVISRNDFWVIIDRPYLYTNNTLLGLIYKFITEYKSDKHLVG